VALLWLAVLFSGIDDCFADYAVQVGAFQSPTSASERMAAVDRFGLPSIVEKIGGSGNKRLTMVLVGPYPDVSQAESAQIFLATRGINGFVRSYRNKGDGIHEAKAVTPIVNPPIATVDATATGAISLAAVGQEASPTGLWFRRMAAAVLTEPPQSSDSQTKPTPSSLPFSFSGHVQTALAYTVAHPEHWSKIKNTLALALERELTDDIKLKVSGRFSYDGAYDVSNFYPEKVRRDQRFDGLFHETYLDVGLQDWNLRLGRQNIIWGEVVGLFFADVVSAKDLREFLIPEFDYIRIPQWAARAEYFTGDFKAEAIWIPYMTYDRIGKPGSDFYPIPLTAPPGFGLQVRSERTPHSLRDSAFGFRASYLTHGWDLATFYYGSVDANTTFFRSTILAPGPTVSYRPDHERVHQAGLTASKDVGSFVLKGEAIYTWDRFFNVKNANDADGVVRQNFLEYIISAEFPLPMESRLNLQFFQRWFPNHDADIVQRRVESGASLFASTKLFNEKVEPEFLLIQSLTQLDWMARFKINWYFAKDWRFVAGTAFFGGKKLGLFGRFDKEDRVFTELRYTF
jgi:hypothetical protein